MGSATEKKTARMRSVIVAATTVLQLAGFAATPTTSVLASAPTASPESASAPPKSAPPRDATKVWHQPAGSATGAPASSSARTNATLPSGMAETELSSDHPFAPRQAQNWSPFTHTVHRSDGTSTVQIYASPAFRSTGGAWAPVDTTVTAQADPAQPLAAPNALWPIRFGRDGSRLIEFDLPGGTVTFSLGDLHLSPPTLVGNRVEYRDAADGVTLDYGVSPDGVKEDIRLDSAASPTTLHLHIADPNRVLGVPSADQGGYAFSRRLPGGIGFRLAAPDAYEQPASDTSPPLIQPGSAHLTLSKAGDGYDATIGVDASWLSGKHFPIVLDPTQQWAGTGTWDGYGPTTDCGGCAVYQDNRLVTGTDQYHAWRSWFRFDMSSIPVGASVSQATLALYRWGCLNSGPCATPAVEIHPITTLWDYGSTIQSILNATGSTAITSGYAGNGNTGLTEQYVVTSQVQSWVTGTAPAGGFSVQLATEGLGEGGHYYSSTRDSSAFVPVTPSMTVTYNTGVSQVQPGSAPSTVAQGEGFNGFAYSLAIGSGGTASAWGDDSYGELGTGLATPNTVPQPVSGLSNVVAVAAGAGQSLFLRNDGTVWAAGFNGLCAVGGGNSGTNYSTAVQVPGLTNIVSIATGRSISAAISSSGTLYTWGDGYLGQLGHPATDFDQYSGPCSETPHPVVYASGAIAGPYVQFESAFNSSFALKVDGTVEAWGDDSFGQLGTLAPPLNPSFGTCTVSLGTCGPFGSVTNPASVVGLSNVTDIASRLGGGAPQLAFASVAIEQDGSLWWWGAEWPGEGFTPPTPVTQPWAPAKPAGLATVDGYGQLEVVLNTGDIWSFVPPGAPTPLTSLTLNGTSSQLMTALSMGGARQVSASGRGLIVEALNGAIWSDGGNFGDGTSAGSGFGVPNLLGSAGATLLSCPPTAGPPQRVSVSPSNSQAVVTWAPAVGGGAPSGYTVAASPNGPQASFGPLTPWTTAGAPLPRLSTANPHSGNFAALLGNTQLEQGVVGDSSMSQAVTVPAGHPQLSFWYYPMAAGTVNPTQDWQEVEVRSLDGQVLATVMRTLSNGTGVNGAGVFQPDFDVTHRNLNIYDSGGGVTAPTFDLSPWTGQSVVLWFNVHQGTTSGSAGMFVDDVAIVGGASANPVQSGDFESASTVLTGLTNGLTYTATVTSTNCLGPGVMSTPSGSFVPRGLPLFTKVTQPSPDPTVSVGNAINYLLTVKNPESSGVMLVDQIQDTLPGDVSGAGTQVQVSGAACTAATVPSCVLNGNSLQIHALTLQPGQQVNIAYSVIAAGIDGACTVTNNVAVLTTTVGTEQVSAPATICDTGLGLEKWWSYETQTIGPQATASVNVASGNLVLGQTDSTPVQGHGHVAYVLRRFYNSELNTSLSFPGQMGAGWQLAVDSGDAGGITPNAIYVPTAQQVTNPLGLAIVDSDGTRHLFTPRALTAAVPVVVAGTPSATAGTLAPVALTADSGYDTVTVDEVFDPPPGVHVALWRYVESSSTCTPAACVLVPRVLGYSAERTDRVRYEFAGDGRLLDLMDSNGVDLRYAYTGTPPQLQAVYEPRSCTLSQALSPSTSHCRAFLFSYAAQQTTATDPAGRVTTYHFDTAVPSHLTSVDNPDGTHLYYTYGGCGGTADQLCSAKDPRGSTTTFTYASSPLGLARIATVTDRKGTQRAFTYSVNLSDGTTTTDVDSGTERHVYTEIDGRGRVGEALQGSEVSGTFTAYRDAVYTWDTGNPCVQPAPIEDNHVCQVVSRSLTVPPHDQVTANLYNQEGQLLRTRRTLTALPTGAGVTFQDTTYGYHAQYAEAGGSPKTYDDTVGAGGVVTSTGPPAGTGRVDPQTIWVVSDRTQSLTPDGNAAGSTYQQYLTTFKPDDNSAVSPSVVPTTTGGVGVCAPGVAAQNTGDLCEVDAPANAGAPPSVMQYTYDSFGEKLTMLTPDAVSGGSTTSPYHYVYYPESALDLSGNVSAGGWLEAIVDPTDHYVQFAEDRAGNVARTWDRNANTTATVSALGVVSLGTTVGAFHATYYASGAGALSAPWRYLVTDVDPVGNTTTYSPDANGNLTSITSPRGKVTTEGFDPDDERICTILPAEATGTPSACSSYITSGAVPTQPATATVVQYDAFGDMTQTTDPNGHVVTEQYDPVNRLVQTHWSQASTGFTAARAYDGDDNLSASQDAVGVTTSFTYDLLGHKVAQSLPRDPANPTTSQLVTQWVYDADGNVTDACPPNQNASVVSACTPVAVFGTHSTYDPAGHVATTTTYQVPSTTPNAVPTSANTATTTETYDADGNPVRIVDPNGHATTRTYDLLDRRVSENRQRDAATLTETDWQYDPSGNTTAAITDTTVPNSTASSTLGAAVVTAYSYDADNRRVDTVQGASSTSATAAGMATGAANVRTRRFYDQDGNLTAMLLPGAFANSVSSPDTTYLARWDYDADGRPSAEYGPRYSTNAANSDLGLSTTQTSQCATSAAPQSAPSAPLWPSGTGVCVTQYQYFAGSQVKQATKPTGAAITYAYLEDNLPSSVTTPSPTGSGTVTAMSYQYDGDGRRTNATDALGHTVATVYTGDGLPSSVTASGTTAHVTSYSYDANGNQTGQTDARLFTSTTGYLSDNLVSSTADGAGDVTSYAYDLAGNKVSVFSPAANAHDPSNASGTPTVYAYTFDNLLSAVTQPVSPDGSLRRETTYTYDLAGRKTAQHVASVNASGQVESDGGTQNFSYYPDGRLSNETTLANGSVSWTYDPAGSPTAITDTLQGTSSVQATYYLDELPRTVDDGTRTTALTYDGVSSAAARQEKVDGSATAYTTTYAYSAAELASSMTSAAGQNGTTSWTYDAGGNTTQETDPNGQKVTSSYNADNELTSRTLANSSGGTLGTWSYGWNADYQQTSQTYSGPGPSAVQGTINYNYDAADRLNSVQLPGTSAFSVSYDHDSNRTGYVNLNDPQHRTQTWTFNADDSVLAYTDATNNVHSYTYYPFGGLQSDGCSSNSYDALYRLTGVAPAPSTGVGTCPTVTSQSYAYDGLDRQRTAGTMSLHYDGLSSQTAVETATTGTDTVYELAPGGMTGAYTVESGSPTTQYLVDDGTRNVAATTTSGQAVACAVRYGPYGEPLQPQASSPCATGSTQSDIFYRGARRDATTGDYQFGSRTYDPTKAAFLTPDSYRNAQPSADLSVGVDPLTLNRYGYVNGDPVNLVDSDGHYAGRLCDGQACEGVQGGSSTEPVVQQGPAPSSPAATAVYRRNVDPSSWVGSDTPFWLPPPAQDCGFAGLGCTWVGHAVGAVGGALATAGKAALTVGAGVVAGVGCEVLTGAETGGLSTAGCVVAGFTAAGAVSGALNCSGSEWKCVGEGAVAGAAGGVAFVATGGVGAGIIGTALAGGAAGAASTATGQALATGHVDVGQALAGAAAGAVTAGVVRGVASAASSGAVASAADTTADAGLNEAFHYTSSDAAQSIVENGLRPGTYATPAGGLSSLQAQLELALPPSHALPSSVVRIDVSGLRGAGYDIPGVTRVSNVVTDGWGRVYTMPGGGYEMQFSYEVPTKFLSLVG